MDEVAPIDLIRQKFRKDNGPRTQRAKAALDGTERSVGRSSAHYTGRSAQMNVRCTPGFKEEMQKAALELGFHSLSEFVAEVLTDYVAKRGKV